MKKEIEIFENKDLNLQVRALQNDDGSISINAEDTAIGFGWGRTEMKNGKEYTSIMWSRMNGFCKELGFAHECAKDDYIPESLYYLLAMKASNHKAQKFQRWLAIDVIPSIRRNGMYKETEVREIEVPDNVITTDKFIRCAEIMAGCPDTNKAYVLNILKNVIPSINEMAPTAATIVEVDESKANIPTAIQEPIIKVKKAIVPRTGYNIPFNAEKFDDYLFDNKISNADLAGELGCCSDLVRGWRSGTSAPVTYYRKGFCNLWGLSETHFNRRKRRGVK